LGLRKMRMEKNHIVKTFMICSPYQILFKFQMSEDELSGVCELYGIKQICIHSFCREV